MHVEEAKKLIRETFQNGFDEDRFRHFAKNLFNDLDESKAFAYQGQFIPDAYKDHVRRYKRLGKYTDPEGAALDVLIVNLKREAALDRARPPPAPPFLVPRRARRKQPHRPDPFRVLPWGRHS